MSKMHKPFAIIFDMDGVILNTEPLHSKSLEAVLSEHKRTPQFNEQGLLHTVGLSGNHIYEAFIKTYDLPYSLESFKQKRRDIFLKIIKNKATINRGVLPLLKRLKKSRIPIGLGSNRNIQHINTILETLHIKDYFDVLVGPSDRLRYKPAPDIYVEAARLLTVTPDQTIVIEDSEAGVTSAHAAGMKIIAIPNYYTKHQDFSKADIIVSKFENITTALLKKLYAKNN